MIFYGPSIQPIIISLCTEKAENLKMQTSRIYDLIDRDLFLKKYLPQLFPEHSAKGGLMGVVSGIGLRALRNSLSEIYLHYLKHGHYPSKAPAWNEVQDIIDIEKRYDFLPTIENQRIFLLGMALKQSQIYLELTDHDLGDVVMGIPSSVDRIIALGRGKAYYSDWLILLIWELVRYCGEEKTQAWMSEHRGKLNRFFHQIGQTNFHKIVQTFLSYGSLIKENDFFLYEKI